MQSLRLHTRPSVKCGSAVVRILNRVNADVLRFFADVMGTNDIVD